MYKIFIIDDEAKAIDNLEYLLQKEIPEELIISSSNNPLKAIQEIHDFGPDLLFIDVQMPHLDGFELLKGLGNIPFEVIFTTAHEHYAIDAIKANALDYLLKPIDGDELQKAFARFQERKSHHENTSDKLHLNDQTNKLAIQQLEGVHFLEIGKIVRLESDANYTKVYSEVQDPIISSKTLRIYDEFLQDHGFMRVHNSHLVNISLIKSILRNEIIIMQDGSEVPLARRKKKELRTLLGLE